MSTTYLMPGTVSDVSATLVASTIAPAGVRARRRGAARRPRAASRAARSRPPRASSVDLAERVRGVADLPLAGQEDQDVAGALRRQLGHGVDDRLGLVADDRLALLVLLGELDEGPVADLDRVGAAADLDDRRRVAAAVGEVLARTARGRSSRDVMISLRSGRRGSSRLR